MTDFTEDGTLKLNEGEKLKAKRGSTDAEEAEDSGTEAEEETTEEEAGAEEIKTQVEKEEFIPQHRASKLLTKNSNCVLQKV